MKHSFYYNCMQCVARILFPRAMVRFAEPPPEEPVVFVGNHAAVCGPVLLTLDLPRKHQTWTIHAATDRKTASRYAFHDVFFGNSRRCRWFWRILSGIVGKALPPLLREAGTIPVYHDARIAATMRGSMKALLNGEDLVIFGESPKRYSPYVNDLQAGFVDLARLYYRKTRKRLAFCPFYVKKRVIAVGTPILYDPEAPMEAQREVIVLRLRDSIDALGRSLPPHKPVPFLPERWYRAYGQYENDFAAYWEMIENGIDGSCTPLS